MSHFAAWFVHRAQGNLSLAAAILAIVAVAHAQTALASDAASSGRLDFEAAKLPAANVEVDLSQEMFKDLFGIGDAAIAGVAETLLKSANAGEGAHGTRIAAEQMQAARQIIQLAGNVVREVRVRAYESLPKENGGTQQLFKPFDEQLKAGNWENVVRVRDKEQALRVSVLRSDGAVHGIFVTATDGHSAVLANVLCDVSPENAKKLTAAATQIGLDNGLGEAIEQNMQKMKHFPGVRESRPAAVIKGGGEKKGSRPAPVPPVPPAPPALPELPPAK